MKRTWFLQYLLNTSHSRVALVDVENFMINELWQDEVEKLLTYEYNSGAYKAEAEAMLKLASGSAREAAKLVMNSVRE